MLCERSIDVLPAFEQRKRLPNPRLNVRPSLTSFNLLSRDVGSSICFAGTYIFGDRSKEWTVTDQPPAVICKEYPVPMQTFGCRPLGCVAQFRAVRLQNVNPEKATFLLTSILGDVMTSSALPRTVGRDVGARGLCRRHFDASWGGFTGSFLETKSRRNEQCSTSKVKKRLLLTSYYVP